MLVPLKTIRAFELKKFEALGQEVIRAQRQYRTSRSKPLPTLVEIQCILEGTAFADLTYDSMVGVGYKRLMRSLKRRHR